MDLRSLLQGKPSVYFKHFAGLRFSADKDPSVQDLTISHPTVEKCQAQTDPSHTASSDKSQNNSEGNFNPSETRPKIVNPKGQRRTDRKQSDGTLKESAVNGTNARTVENLDHLFPKNTHWIIFVFTLIFRVSYVSRKENWWILHPDEVYQTLEVAHSEVYGYGFRTYEYLPAQSPGYHLNAARAQEVGVGMYSLRSFIIPHLLAVVMAIVDGLGISASPFLVGKVFHAIVSSCLPMAVYYFTNSFHRSHTIASLAAILVATSQTLNVLGTHSLVNSFVSPFVFLSLTAFSKPVLPEWNKLPGKDKSRMVDVNQNIPRDQNSNLPLVSDRNRSHSNKKLKASKINQNQTKEHPVKCIRKESQKYCKPTLNIKLDIQEYLSGFCLSVCVYTRCDIVLLPIFVAIAYSKLSCYALLRLVLQLHNFVAGFVTGFLIGGFYDRWCYGIWFISPTQWIKFNVFHKASHVLFGSESVMFYISNVFPVDFPGMCLLFIFILDLMTSRFFTVYKFRDKSQSWRGGNMFTLYVFMMLLLPYSISSHKELRFFHNGLVVLYIHISSAIIRLIEAIVIYANQKHSQYYYYFYLFIGFLASSQIVSFIQIQDKGISRWTYRKQDTTHHVNLCLNYINEQFDVTGVFVDQSIYMTGGYTILHKNVPVFALNRNEFFEFDLKNRLHSSNLLNQNLSLSVFAQISDFVSVYNTPFLLKQLLLKPEYNYLVLKTDRQFVEIGYTEVFRFGSSKVMKRKMTNESEAELSKLALSIPLGSNATILEYEGYWLKRYGLYKKAEEKLLLANRLDQSRIGPYQLLIAMFQQFKQRNLIKNVLDACTEVHKKSKCLEKYNPVQLHELLTIESFS